MNLVLYRWWSPLLVSIVWTGIQFTKNHCTAGTYNGDDDNNNDDDDDDDDDGSDNNEGRMEDTENLRSRLRERRRTEERQKATEKEKREVFRWVGAWSWCRPWRYIMLTLGGVVYFSPNTDFFNCNGLSHDCPVLRSASFCPVGPQKLIFDPQNSNVDLCSSRNLIWS